MHDSHPSDHTHKTNKINKQTHYTHHSEHIAPALPTYNDCFPKLTVHNSGSSNQLNISNLTWQMLLDLKNLPCDILKLKVEIKILELKKASDFHCCYVCTSTKLKIFFCLVCFIRLDQCYNKSKLRHVE